jgi:hypothetical protein
MWGNVENNGSSVVVYNTVLCCPHIIKRRQTEKDSSKRYRWGRGIVVGSKETENGGLRELTLALLIPRWTLSYIGAGTGSLIIQVVIAATVGGLFALKLYWRRIKGFFLRRKEAGDGPGREEDEAPRSIDAELLPAQATHASDTEQGRPGTGVPLGDARAEE